MQHWPREVGLGVGPTVIVGGAQIDATTLTYAAGLDPNTVIAQGEAAGEAIGQQFGAQVKATWDQQTSTAANESRKLQGAADAIDLATNGFNPDSPADDAKLVGVIAGALAFIPVAGPFLSGALVLLYAIGEGIADLLKSAGLIWYGCRTSGNWTTKNILDGMALPPMPAGSFASLAIPALAKNAATISNCQSGFSNLQILAAITQLWNANSSGPPMSIYVPAIDTSGGGSVFAVSDQTAAAFQAANAVTDILGDEGANANGISGPFWTQAPFILQLNGSMLNLSAKAQAPTPTTTSMSTPTPTTTSMSTGGKVAVVGGSLAAGAVVGTLVFSYVKGEAVGAVVKGAWRGVMGWFGR